MEKDKAVDELLNELAEETAPVEDMEIVEDDPIIEDDVEDADTYKDKDPEKSDPYYSQKVSARLVDSLNALIKVSAKKAYKSILRPGDVQLYNELKQQIKYSQDEQEEYIKISQDAKARNLFDRFERYDQLVKDAPLTPEEKEAIIAPLTEVVEKYKWLQFGPEAQLLVTVFLIMLPRIEPLFPSATDLIKFKQ